MFGSSFRPYSPEAFALNILDFILADRVLQLVWETWSGNVQITSWVFGRDGTEDNIAQHYHGATCMTQLFLGDM